VITNDDLGLARHPTDCAKHSKAFGLQAWICRGREGEVLALAASGGWVRYRQV
jgi:hypothetical protein